MIAMNFCGEVKTAEPEKEKLEKDLRKTNFPKKNMALVLDVMVNKLYGQESNSAQEKPGSKPGQAKTLIPK